MLKFYFNKIKLKNKINNNYNVFLNRYKTIFNKINLK